ncbi:MAG: tRNA-ribosyltransferase family protein [Ktedonobacterales bacterium]
MMNDLRCHGIDLPHGALSLPAFLPDATYGVVRSVGSDDLRDCGINGLVMNTFHLMQRPGSSVVRALGGLHSMGAWPGPIITDSGGFQAYSLIRQNAKYGSITENGIVLRPERLDRKLLLTPEKSIQLQLRYDTDIAICLDDCTHVDAPFAVQEASTERTIKWARRCKDEFDRIVGQRRSTGQPRPQLFAVIQGGGYRELRKRCAESLLEIGFDGFGYGGWPLDSEGHLLVDMLAYSRELIPPEFPMHALGVGHPRNVVDSSRLGYALFDSALPTRDARHGRLYALGPEPLPARGVSAWFDFVYVNDPKHVKANTSIFPECTCSCCAEYTLGYLHHLFKLGDGLFTRLATIHNLTFMARLMQRLGAPLDESWK